MRTKDTVPTYINTSSERRGEEESVEGECESDDDQIYFDIKWD